MNRHDPQRSAEDHSLLPDDDSTDNLLFAKLCDDFSRRALAGEEVSIENYISQYPQFTRQIRTAFPALLMMGAAHPPRTQQPDESADECPQQIAGCEIVRCIGRGGMGVVYEATHPTVSRRVAIKILKTQRQQQRGFRERFIREAEASSRLNHPNIVPFIDCGEDNGTAYLSMLYIDGESLDHGMNRHWDAAEDTRRNPPLTKRADQHQQVDGDSPHTSPRIVKGKSDQSRNSGLQADFIANDFKGIALLGADVAGALAHAHERNAIHRDIKPANLILDECGKVWVTDFGLAKLHDDDSDLSKAGDMIGTPRYMAPEQFRGIADERSDIYSLGVTLYELVTGAKAWDGSEAHRSKHKRSHDLPTISRVNPNVPPALARIITKACAHSAAKRYGNAADLQFALNQFAHGGSIVDRRGLPRGSARRTWTRDLILATALIITLAMGMTFYFMRTLPTRSGEAISAAHIDELADETNTSPVVGGEHRRTIDVAEGSTDVDTLSLTGSDPNGDPFSWTILPDEDASRFIVQRLSGHLCFRTPPRVAIPGDLNSDNIYELHLTPTDRLQPHVAVLLTNESNTVIQMTQPATGDTTFTTLPNHLLAASSKDGNTLLHTNLSKDGTIALYRSTLNGDRPATELLQANCKLTPFVRGLACESDRRFLAIMEIRDGFALQWLQLDDDQTFYAVGSQITMNSLSDPIGLSCLGDGDFQILDQRNDATVLLEVAVSEDAVAGVRELPTGWKFRGNRLLGMTAWVTQTSTEDVDESAVQPVRIRVRSE